MQRLVVGLAAYAAAVGTWLLIAGGGAGTAARPASSGVAAANPVEVDLRAWKTETRDMVRAEQSAFNDSLGAQMRRLEALVLRAEQGVASGQKLAEESARHNTNQLEALLLQVQSVEGLIKSLEALETRLEGIEKRVEAVEKRPAVIREVVKEGSGQAAERPPEPARPTLPTEPTEDPEVVRQRVSEALAGLKSSDVNTLVPAIEVLRRYRHMEAVPGLIEIMLKHSEWYPRMAAAAALGSMRAVDAVMALADALVDDHASVAQVANKSVRQITDFDAQLSPTARIRERRAARGALLEWWRDHEAEVRKRLAEASGG